jgi:hypothetical protein
VSDSFVFGLHRCLVFLGGLGITGEMVEAMPGRADTTALSNSGPREKEGASTDWARCGPLSGLIVTAIVGGEEND